MDFSKQKLEEEFVALGEFLNELSTGFTPSSRKNNSSTKSSNVNPISSSKVENTDDIFNSVLEELDNVSKDIWSQLDKKTTPIASNGRSLRAKKHESPPLISTILSNEPSTSTPINTPPPISTPIVTSLPTPDSNSNSIEEYKNTNIETNNEENESQTSKISPEYQSPTISDLPIPHVNIQKDSNALVTRSEGDVTNSSRTPKRRSANFIQKPLTESTENILKQLDQTPDYESLLRQFSVETNISSVKKTNSQGISSNDGKLPRSRSSGMLKKEDPLLFSPPSSISKKTMQSTGKVDAIIKSLEISFQASSSELSPPPPPSSHNKKEEMKNNFTPSSQVNLANSNDLATRKTSQSLSSPKTPRDDRKKISPVSSSQFPATRVPSNLPVSPEVPPRLQRGKSSVAAVEALLANKNNENASPPIASALDKKLEETKSAPSTISRSYGNSTLKNLNNRAIIPDPLEKTNSKTDLQTKLARQRSNTTMFSSDDLSVKRSLKIRTPTPGKPTLLLTIMLKDLSKKKIIVTDDFTIEELYHTFTDKIDLWQLEYFALCEEKGDGNFRWLLLDKTIAEEELKMTSKIILKVRYWKEPRKLIDPVAAHLYYIEVRDQFVKTNFLCSETTAFYLAAYQMQLVYGDFIPEKHKIGFFDSTSLSNFLPPYIIANIPIEYIQKVVFSLYAKLHGLPTPAVELKFLEIAKKHIPLYGVQFYNVKEENSDRILGIAEDGIFISTKKQRDEREIFDFFSFEEIGGWDLLPQGIKISIINPEKKPSFLFTTNQSRQISQSLTEYYSLLQTQLGTLRPIVLPDILVDLPFHQIFLFPKKRSIVDPHYSRLEMFKLNYLEECKITGTTPIFKLLNEIDNYLVTSHPLENPPPLTELNLQKSQVTGEKLDLLIKTISKVFKYKTNKGTVFLENFKISTINCSFNPIGSNGIASLGALIEGSFPIKVLHLEEVKMEAKGAIILASSLEKLKELEDLSVAKNELSNKGINAIINATKHLQLKSLDIGENEADSKIGTFLGEIISKSIQLKSLKLSNNKIGDSGLSNIFKSLRRSPVQTIQTLDISNTGVGSSASKEIIMWLTENYQLIRIDLSKNELGDKFWSELATLIGRKTNELAELHARNCNIGNKVLKELCFSFAHSKLTVVDLSGSSISKTIGTILCSSLETCKINTLFLRSCALDKSTIQSLLKLLKNNPTHPLKKLDLFGTDFSRRDLMEDLEIMLTFNTTLQELGISKGQITQQTFQILCKALTKNEALRSLYLDVNKIGKLFPKLAEALRTSKLEKLSVRACEISFRDFSKFLSILNPSTTLKYLNLSGNNIEKEKFSESLKAFPNLEVEFEE